MQREKQKASQTKNACRKMIEGIDGTLEKMEVPTEGIGALCMLRTPGREACGQKKETPSSRASGTRGRRSINPGHVTLKSRLSGQWDKRLSTCSTEIVYADSN